MASLRSPSLDGLALSQAVPLAPLNFLASPLGTSDRKGASEGTNKHPLSRTPGLSPCPQLLPETRHCPYAEPSPDPRGSAEASAAAVPGLPGPAPRNLRGWMPSAASLPLLGLPFQLSLALEIPPTSCFKVQQIDSFLFSLLFLSSFLSPSVPPFLPFYLFIHFIHTVWSFIHLASARHREYRVGVGGRQTLGQGEGCPV